MFKLITPKTENQLNKYYQFRWQLLREPWRMPVGSERDEYDGMSHHRMITDSVVVRWRLVGCTLPQITMARSAIWR